MSLVHGNNLTYGCGTVTGPMMRTAVTREDFNIEDLHCQIVLKVQRAKQLVKEIEALPMERDLPPTDFMEEAEFLSNRKGARYGSNQRTSSAKRNESGYYP